MHAAPVGSKSLSSSSQTPEAVQDTLSLNSSPTPEHIPDEGVSKEFKGEYQRPEGPSEAGVKKLIQAPSEILLTAPWPCDNKGSVHGANGTANGHLHDANLVDSPAEGADVTRKGPSHGTNGNANGANGYANGANGYANANGTNGYANGANGPVIIASGLPQSAFILGGRLGDSAHAKENECIKEFHSKSALKGARKDLVFPLDGSPYSQNPEHSTVMYNGRMQQELRSKVDSEFECFSPGRTRSAEQKKSLTWDAREVEEITGSSTSNRKKVRGNTSLWRSDFERKGQAPFSRGMEVPLPSRFGEKTKTENADNGTESGPHDQLQHVGSLTLRNSIANAGSNVEHARSISNAPKMESADPQM